MPLAWMPPGLGGGGERPAWRGHSQQKAQSPVLIQHRPGRNYRTTKGPEAGLPLAAGAASVGRRAIRRAWGPLPALPSLAASIQYKLAIL